MYSSIVPVHASAINANKHDTCGQLNERKTSSIASQKATSKFSSGLQKAKNRRENALND